MDEPSKDGKATLIETLAHKARRRVAAGKADAVARFVRQYFANVAPDDLADTSETALLGAALSLWSFLQQRAPRRPKVRVFNPTIKRDDWDCGHSVIEIVNDDMPFLVDSVTAMLNQAGLTIHIAIHPVVRVRRSAAGRLAELFERGATDEGGASESLMHIEINEQALPETLKTLAAQIEVVLSDVRLTVDDWRAMRVRIADVIGELDSTRPPLPLQEVEETRDFLRWVDDNHFTFIGYCEYAFKPRGKKTALAILAPSILGLLRKPNQTVFEGMKNGATLSVELADFVRRPHLLMVSKANIRSSVHRAVHLDTIGIKRFDDAGNVIGERLFVGLFTSGVYIQPIRDIPLLRRKVDCVVSRAGFAPTGHDAKALHHILETLPRDELFQAPENELYDTAIGVLHLQERQRTALFVRRDPFARFASCLVYVPRDRFNTALRVRLAEIVEKGLGGEVRAHNAQLSDSALARIHFIVRTPKGAPPPKTVEAIETELALAARDWSDELSHALVATHGEANGLDLFRAFQSAFPAGYRESFSAAEAVQDLVRIDQVCAGSPLAVALDNDAATGSGGFRLRIYNRSAPVALSDVLPVLENMGLKALDEVPHRIEPKGAAEAVFLQVFGLASRLNGRIDLAKVRAKFEAAFGRVWANDAENDGLNRLVLAAGLDWRQIIVLRTYCKYMHQIGLPFSQAYIEQTLARNATVAALLVELFEAMFDLAAQAKAKPRTDALSRRILGFLDSIANPDEDRILRRYLNLIQATLRTNYYQLDSAGKAKPYVSIKIDSRSVDEMPLPRPLVEIFVYSPRMEGIHLRGGKVARGGIRWSDRREDFRTEILGLMKAQMTKNAVIVPVGAKGGFVLKRPPTSGGREALQAEGIECYKTLIRGMLDLTDNLMPGRPVPPAQVVRRDGDDPYLVVAADKGTATFSDIANGVARDYGFWLDDAFASGGSVGYDHKKMGITARGAWESVKRHFREIGVDVQSEDFTCVGVGDMSGDVFGNGMLQSLHIRLIAAFNHMHIFVDPDPDAKRGIAERRRLFRLQRSSWADYDAKLISRGGGVFERSAKSIRTTPEMRKLFELGERESVAPNELLRAIMKAPADLLFLGGIGSYVRASDESDAEVGDRANDAIRVAGRELRCKVAGEGANLGFTQRGRIEYALAGGRLNTDFIDNAAGVDCSDHEVNIKILLGEVMAARKLTTRARDKLLAAMTDEVGELVLVDNYRQTMALTQAEAQGVAYLDECQRFIRGLEKAGKLNRAVEYLPDDDAIEERRNARRGMTRPELSVLLAYAKMTLFEELIASDVPDEAFLLHDVALYFPRPLRGRFGAYIPRHRLRREISATYVTNSLVNRTGPGFISEMHELTGRSAPDITRAYLACRQVYGLRALWLAIEALDSQVPSALQTEMNLEISRLIRRGTLWFLRNGPHRIDIMRLIDTYGPGAQELAQKLDRLISAELGQRIHETTDLHVKAGAPAALAFRIASLDVIASACDIIRIAAGVKRSAESVARVYFAIGSRLGFDWLRARTKALSAENAWQRMAVTAVIDDLYAQQTDLTAKLARERSRAGSADAVIEGWLTGNRHAPAIHRIEMLLSELKSAKSVDLSMVLVANREIRSLIDS